MPPTIENFRPEDAAQFLRVMGMSFLSPPPADGGKARAENWLRLANPDPTRTFAAYDGTKIVGTFRTMPLELTLPGGTTVTSDGAAAVTVAPTHRRQGLLTGMMTRSLRNALDRGEPVGALYASEAAIYGRFGFGPATEQGTWEIDVHRLGPQPTPTGIETVTPEELLELGPPAYERAARQRPGGMKRPAYRWTIDLGLGNVEGEPPDWAGYAVVHRDTAGEVDGFLRWHPQDKWENWRSDSVLHVDELIAATPEAYRELWRFAFSVDLIATVRAGDRRVDEPVAHLPGVGRAATMVQHSDGLWLRVLDVPAVLETRRYDAAGRIVVEVVDPVGLSGGTYALEAGPDGATCKPTGESAELTLPVTVLGSAVLGGFRLRTLAEAGLLDEHRAGALEVADRLLAAPLRPWGCFHF